MKTFEEIFETIPGNGWLTKEEAWLLWTSVNETDGPILEVGCLEGRSTCLLAATGRMLTCVDPFVHGSEQAFRRNIEERGLWGTVTLLQMKVEDVVLLRQDLHYGFCYLDGDHTYEGTLAQVKFALGCSPRIVAVHDVNDSGGGLAVKRACLELLGPWRERVERLAVWEI